MCHERVSHERVLNVYQRVSQRALPRQWASYPRSGVVGCVTSCHITCKTKAYGNMEETKRENL